MSFDWQFLKNQAVPSSILSVHEGVGLKRMELAVTAVTVLSTSGLKVGDQSRVSFKCRLLR